MPVSVFSGYVFVELRSDMPPRQLSLWSRGRRTKTGAVGSVLHISTRSELILSIEVMLPTLLNLLIEMSWTTNATKTKQPIAIGHCTRPTTLNHPRAPRDPNQDQAPQPPEPLRRPAHKRPANDGAPRAATTTTTTVITIQSPFIHQDPPTNKTTTTPPPRPTPGNLPHQELGPRRQPGHHQPRQPP